MPLGKSQACKEIESEGSTRAAALNRVAWLGHTEKMTLLQRLEGGKDVGYMVI